MLVNLMVTNWKGCLFTKETECDILKWPVVGTEKECEISYTPDMYGCTYTISVAAQGLSYKNTIERLLWVHVPKAEPFHYDFDL